MSIPGLLDDAASLVATGRQDEAIAMIESAANGGDVDALMQQAVWHLGGEIIPRDLPKARELLRRAVAIGHVDAALMEIALTANGSGEDADWPAALALLRTAARGDPVAADQLALVDAMGLDENGFPLVASAASRLSCSPNLVRFVGFLTPSECAHLAQAAMPLLEPSTIIDPISGQYRPDPVRLSSGAVIGPAREDLVIACILRRIAAASGSLWTQGEPLAVLHYAPGQQYRPHFDTIAGEDNQRVKTFIIYLNDAYEGGETAFTEANIVITPKVGDAILFDNLTADGKTDPRSRHAGLAVKSGAKWIATRWIRRAPYDPWTR